MNQHMSFTYHQAPFDLIQKTPRISSQAIKTLDQLERVHTFMLPASVREWYSLEGAVAILLKNTENHPVNFRH